jgi:hypothetical protein
LFDRLLGSRHGNQNGPWRAFAGDISRFKPDFTCKWIPNLLASNCNIIDAGLPARRLSS